LLLDRRTDHSFGYRAVHVVAYVSRLPVEIQVRTDLQHRWAEVVERLADQWGRGLRYGLGPEDPDRRVLSDSSTTLTRREFIAELMQWSETVDDFEKIAQELALRHAAAGRTSPQISALYERLCTVEDGLRGRLKLYLMLCDRLG
jgi:Region found in RelA / SpoT proteins